MPARAGDEDGFSLIELLIAIVVLGIGGVAVLTAMTTSLTASSVHRSLSSGEVVTRDFAEAARARAIAATVPPCQDLAATASTYESISYPGSADYRVDVVGVDYWLPDAANPAGGSYVGPTACADAYAARCAGLSAPASFCDASVQRLTISVTTRNETGVSATNQSSRVFVRRGPT